MISRNFFDGISVKYKLKIYFYGYFIKCSIPLDTAHDGVRHKRHLSFKSKMGLNMRNVLKKKFFKIYT